MGYCVITVLIIAIMMFLIMKNKFLNLMINEFRSDYSYENTIEIIKERISSKKGWHIFGVIDQGNEIIKNGGNYVGKITIIHYCNGIFASRMFSDDLRKKISIFSPKAIAVYEKKDGNVYVAMMNSMLMKLFSSGEMKDIVKAVSSEVKEIIAPLIKRGEKLKTEMNLQQ